MYDGMLPFTPDANPAGGDLNALKATLVWAAPDTAPLNGPVWLAQQHLLLFTDGKGKILQFDGKGNVTTWGDFPGVPVGLALAGDKLVACERAAKRVAYIDIGTKKETVIVDKVDGHSFDGPWECDVGSDGTVYFTDIKQSEQDPNYSMRPIYAAKGSSARLLTTLLWDVGVHLSLAEDLLLSPADFPGHVVTGLPLNADGTVAERTRWGDMRREGGAGMCVDDGGNVYVTGIQGVEVFHANGSRYDEFVWVNSGDLAKYDRPTNCAFGDDDRKTLYITFPGALGKARVNIPGLPN